MHTVNYYVILHYIRNMRWKRALSEMLSVGGHKFKGDDDTKTFNIVHKNCFKSPSSVGGIALENNNNGY